MPLKSRDQAPHERPKPLPQTGLTGPDGQRIPWGPIQGYRAIGEYLVVEYLRDESNIVNWDPESSRHGKLMYQPWLNGKALSHSFDSLDEALLYAIAVKYDGLNTRAHQYFLRGVGA